MARIYETTQPGHPTDVTGSKLSAFDTQTQSALKSFWASVAAVVLAALILYFTLSRMMSGRASGIIAIVAAAAAIGALLIMHRALGKLHVVSKREWRADERIEDVLEQLDDRFAIFNGLRAGDAWVDHLIVGPSGIFTLKTSVVPSKDGHPRAVDIRDACAERDEVQKLIRQISPLTDVTVDAVACLSPGHTPIVERTKEGVWVVAAEKIVAGMLKRSGQAGAITHGVDKTGAFMSDVFQAAALEHALAEHWNVRLRKTQADFVPPARLTGSGE